MDATEMSFKDGSFPLAVDKGTLDAMCAGSYELAGKLAAEVYRVLQPGGLWILVSHSGQRLVHLQSHGDWQCLELRRCRLSPQATFINALRARLPVGAPLREAFEDPQVLQEAAEEAKMALRRGAESRGAGGGRRMAFIDAFRIFKARKRAQAGVKREVLSGPEEGRPNEKSHLRSTGAA